MKKPKKKSDANELAFDIARRATGESPSPGEPEKDPAAVKRGKARAERLTPEERQEIARKGANARWKNRTRHKNRG